MRYLLIIFLLCLPAGEVAAESSSTTGSSATLIEIGRRIYQEGLLEGGAELQGVSTAQVSLKGRQAACIGCHRKSGLGTSEGKSIISSIAGKFLFPAAQAGVDASKQSEMHRRASYKPANTRAAYTQDSFAKVLREGVDFAGQPLDRLMPRYTLNNKEVAALAAYLKTLSAQPDPGVDQNEIHFATVVMPGAKPQESKAMLDVLNAFFGDKNGGSRSEGKRHTVGSEAMYRSYRRWVLHVWTLTGPAEGWKAQLEQEYSKQPVFAVISGIGGANWEPLHNFCEQNAIPCVFPNSNLPVTDNAYYSFYLSRGIALEAEVLARHFESNPGKQGTIVQVFNEKDSQGAEAAKVLRNSLARTAAARDIVDWPFVNKPDGTSWDKMFADKPPQTLVLWLNGDDLARFEVLETSGYLPRQIFMSASLLGSDMAGGNLRLPGKFLTDSLDRIRLIYPYELPSKTVHHLQRTKLWLRAKKIEITDERVQANTYLAAMVTGDAIAHILDQFYRDYFIERVEHMVNRSLVTSVYPHLSLGPGQRFASKGAYLVKFSRQKDMAVEPVTDWIVPH